jgi:transposase
MFPPADAACSQRELLATIRQLKEMIAALNQTIAEIVEENRTLKRMLFGPSSERSRSRSAKMPSVTDAVRDAGEQGTDVGVNSDGKRPDHQRTRKASGRAARKTPTLKEEHHHHKPTTCTRCDGVRLTSTGVEDISEEIEFMPSQFVRIVHHRHRKRCLDCEHIIHAPPSYRPAPNSVYGTAAHAYVAVAKCADSMPVHRLSKSMERMGLANSRSTMNDMFHRVAEHFAPVHARLLELVRESSYVNADETPIRIQAPGKCKTGYVWTFIAPKIIAFVFAATRSGDVPMKVLGISDGKLTVDGYSGYNAVCIPEGRERSGCLAHVRRKFWDALQSGDDAANEPIALILKMYMIEYEAAEKSILKTEAHQHLRVTRGRRHMVELFVQCRQIRKRYPPKSPLGKAARYVINNWRALRVIMHDVQLRLDNNIAEGALRIIALGRKNFLFVGNCDGGHSLAVLQTIVSTCKANDINPFDYMVDVMPRLAAIDHKDVDALEALLPTTWGKSPTVPTPEAIV